MNQRISPESLWHKRLAAVERAWPAMRRGDVEALHQVRVASRRIREALPVVASSADETRTRKLRRKVRALTRWLGPVRELDVELGVLAELEETAPAHRAAIDLVRRRIEDERKTLRDRMNERTGEVDLKKLVRKLKRLTAPRDAKGDPPERKVATWRNVLAARAARRAIRLRDAIDHAGGLYLSDRLHGVRIAAKKLRYILEVAEGTGASRLGASIRSLKAVQEVLGRINDLQSLLGRVHEVEAAPRVASGRGDLKRFARSLEQECRRLHAEFVVRREAALKICDVARDALAVQISVGRPRAARVVHARTSARVEPQIGGTAR